MADGLDRAHLREAARSLRARCATDGSVQLHPDAAMAVADWLDVTARDVGTSSLAYHAPADVAEAVLTVSGVPVTAGREQDAREALRALSEAATPGPWAVDPTPEFQHRIRSAGHEPSWVLGDHVADAVFDPDAAFIAAAVNYVRAALLPSPPAITGAGDDGDWSQPQDGAHVCNPDCRPPMHRYGFAAASPPATGAPTARSLTDGDPAARATARRRAARGSRTDTRSQRMTTALSDDDLVAAVALWLCDTYEPEAGPPCIGHFLEAAGRLDATPGAVVDQLDNLPGIRFDGANRYNTDDEQALTLWIDGQTWDVRWPR